MKQKQTHPHREETCGVKEERLKRDGLEVCDQQMQTGIYKMDYQQGPTV